MSRRTLLRALLMVFIVIAFMSPVYAENNTEPLVWTDELDYFPGETVLIIGSGFKPNVPLTINISRPDAMVDIVYAQSNEAGNFSCYYGPVWITGEYNVTVTDGVNIAETVFTDYYVIIRMYYSEDHKPFSDEVDRRGYDYVFNPGKNAYIGFYELKPNTDYKVEFWAYPDINVSSMADIFNSGDSNSLNYTVLIPSDVPLSTDGNPWNIKVYEKTNSGWCIRSFKKFWVAKIETYKDPAHTQLWNNFSPGDTIYIKGEGFKPSEDIMISYYYKGNSCHLKIYGPYCTPANEYGSFETEFICTGPKGEWVILARWNTWSWCTSMNYKTENFFVDFVVPEIPLGTVSALLMTLFGLVSYNKISRKK